MVSNNFVAKYQNIFPISTVIFLGYIVRMLDMIKDNSEEKSLSIALLEPDYQS